jgi:hypothetical protein
MATFRPALTEPGFRNALVVAVGWILTGGPHAVTQALVATDVARRRHWEAFHRFFSRGAWDPDHLGLLLLGRIAKLLPRETPIRAAIDDTLTPKKGLHVFGIGSHLDAVRSTKAHRVFCFGHVWVMLAVVIRVPFSSRPWALPVFLRLYRNKKECEAKGHPYRKKTELARETLDLLAKWAGSRRIEVSMDSAYCNDTVMRDLPSTILVFGAMRPDAVLTDLPKPKPRRKGRRAVRGKLLPKPQALARNPRHDWQTCVAHLYGEQRTIYFKTLCGQWYRACGARLLRIVVVRVDHGAIPLRVFFCTDPTIGIVQLLEGYAQRWAIEVCFRDLKQLLGFGDSSARKKQAVERTAPFVAYIYTLLVLWFLDDVYRTPVAAPPVRPWYAHKNGLCFADVLRAAQRVLAPLDVLDPARSFDDLLKLAPEAARSSSHGAREAV